ncbi:MAG: bifunctional hydroxymethylpyrimidine kinase/phosphomethylpyrimidine kinase [Bryobacteraceae bacterium]|nr:bifunctional hydroxymethylpyrimidine kinase/phosphomethylpyrimidine kinase [Bryobacteraceae bacterium]
MTPVALTIAGSDPSGGAGIQADLKTFHQFGVYGTAAITLLTVQNTVGVAHVECLSGDLIVRQVQAVLDDLPPAAAKVGALGSAAAIEALSSLAESFEFPLVVDPVMVSKHGASLLAATAREALVKRLLPRATLVTPNLNEAGALAGMEVKAPKEMRRAAERIQSLGAPAVLVKGGHLAGRAIDFLLDAEGRFWEFEGDRVDTQHTHGTGCTYSAAITAGLARGLSLREAIAAAKRYITAAIRTNPGLGKGSGPVNHWASS